MLRGLKNTARLLRMGRVLARHDAGFFLTEAGAPPWVARSLRLFAPLGPDAGTAKLDRGERLARALHSMGPSFVKMGQNLSVRPDLVGEQLAQDLAQLRDRMPPFPASDARAVIEAEFGCAIEDLFAHFEPEPVAAASIAQVHFAESAAGTRLAVKVLRPGIEDAFARDLDLFYWVAELVERFAERSRRLRPIAVVETVEKTVRLEMDLRLEAAASEELGEAEGPDARFKTPKIEWELTARRVLTMERIEGLPIANREALVAAGHDPKRLAHDLIQSFLTQALARGFFHADLHQGNLFVLPDGRIAAVDFGIMGRLDPFSRSVMADILLAFIEGDYRRAALVHFEAGYVPADQSLDAFTQACRSVGAPIRNKPVKDISLGRLLAQLFEITETFGMETQPQLLLLQKSMVTVEGVARSLDDDVNFWDASKPVIRNWLQRERGVEARLREAARALGEVFIDAPRIIDGLRRLALGQNQSPRLDVEIPPAPRAGAWLALTAAFMLGAASLYLILDAVATLRLG